MLTDPHALLPIAYRAAVQVVQSPILAEEASERAIHQLMLEMLAGSPPQSPKAWLRVVARRSACALLRSEWARTRSMDLEEVAAGAQRPYAVDNARRSWVRENLHDALTPRQQEALAAAISNNTTRAAARTCGMEPRDFRRSLHSISRRAQKLLASSTGIDRDTPGCESGMAV